MEYLEYIPGYSKSYTHRFIILAWINRRDIVIKNFTTSNDVKATLNSLYSDYKIINGDLYLEEKNRVERDKFFVGESGSTLRFLIPLMLNGSEVTFVTEGRLAERPLNEFKRLILEEGGEFSIDGKIIRLRGNLTQNTYSVSTKDSSQFVSGMMMASQGRYKVEYNPGKSLQYIKITEDSIRLFKNRPSEVFVPVDMSNYSLFYALYKKNFIKKIVKARGRKQNDSVFIDYVDSIRKKYNLEDAIDITPMLAAYLSTIDGEFELNGLSNLKFKESNRLKEIIDVLEFFGVPVNTNGVDKIYVKGSSKRRVVRGVYKVNDHRICHMLIFLKIYHKSDLKIFGAESLKKSDEKIYYYFKRRRYV